MDKYIAYSKYYKMIDINKKNLTFRKSICYGIIYIGKLVFNYIKNNKIFKGNPLILSEISAINAVKNTSKFIILCHPINIENVFIKIYLDNFRYNVNLYCLIKSYSKTGVEIESKFGVLIGMLSIYDLIKSINPYSYINYISLLYKLGGKSGLIYGNINNIPKLLKYCLFNNIFDFVNIYFVLFFISDRISCCKYKNLTYKIMFNYININNGIVINSYFIFDSYDLIYKSLYYVVNVYNYTVILISGGTGYSYNDLSYKVMYNICDKIIFGISEYFKYLNFTFNKFTYLSNIIIGLFKQNILLLIPGSYKFIYQSLNFMLDFISHLNSLI